MKMVLKVGDLQGDRTRDDKEPENCNVQTPRPRWPAPSSTAPLTQTPARRLLQHAGPPCETCPRELANGASITWSGSAMRGASFDARVASVKDPGAYHRVDAFEALLCKHQVVSEPVGKNGEQHTGKGKGLCFS